MTLYRVMKVDLELRFFDDTNAISFLFTNMSLFDDVQCGLIKKMKD